MSQYGRRWRGLTRATDHDVLSWLYRQRADLMLFPNVCCLFCFLLPMMSFGPQLGPLRFHSSNELHQGSLGSERRPTFSGGWGRGNGVQRSFHICPKDPAYMRDRTRGSFVEEQNSSKVNVTLLTLLFWSPYIDEVMYSSAPVSIAAQTLQSRSICATLCLRQIDMQEWR